MAKILKYDLTKLNILHYIAEHQLTPGDKLPSERELVKMLPGSMITLRRALLELEYDGLLERRTGGRKAGTYIKRNFPANNATLHVLYIYINRQSDHYPGNSLGDVSVYLNSRGIGVHFRSCQTITSDLLHDIHGTAGIILDGWYTEQMVRQLAKQNVPMVLLGNRLPAENNKYAVIRCDYTEAGYLAFRQCVQDGRKKILLLRGSSAYTPYEEMEHGCKKAAANTNSKLLIGKVSPQGGLHIFLDEFMPQHPDIDAIILQYSMFDRIISYFWRTQNVNHPEFIFLDRHPEFSDIVESKYMRWLCFDPLGQKGAETLLSAILNNKVANSVLLKPYFVQNSDFVQENVISPLE